MANLTTIFVTGANTGLGLEILKALCKSSTAYKIFLGSRSISKAETAVTNLKQEFPETKSEIEIVQTDLSSDESLEGAVEKISKATGGRLDVLVNNAGAGYDSEISAEEGKSIRNAWNKSWDTNVSGTQVLTTLIMPLLLASPSPRLIFMTSGTSSLLETEEANTPALKRLNQAPEKGWPKQKQQMEITSYRSTKTGLNMLMREWNRVLRNDGVKVWAVSPGFLATGLGDVGVEKLKKMGALDPAIGGEFTVDVVEGKYDEHVGRIIRKDAVQPW